MSVKCSRSIALMLALLMIAGVLGGCGKTNEPVSQEQSSSEPVPQTTEQPKEAPKPTKDFQLSFGGSAPGGVFYYMIGVLANLLTQEIDGLNVTNVSTGAAQANAIGVAKGELHAGLTYGSLVYEIWNGVGVFEGQQEIGKNIRGVAKAYKSPHYFVALRKSGIKTISDLEGKTVSVGSPGSGAQYNSDLIFDALEINVKKEHLAFADAAAAIKEGRIDAFGQSGAPSGAISELCETDDIIVIPFTDSEMDKLEAASPFYTRNFLSKDTYKGMTEDVQMPFFDVYWVVHKDVPEDIVYSMVETSFKPENMKYLAEGHVLWAELEEDSERFKSLGPEVHPGAKKYFESR